MAGSSRAFDSGIQLNYPENHTTYDANEEARYNLVFPLVYNAVF